MAKIRGKGHRDPQAKDYGASRLTWAPNTCFHAHTRYRIQTSVRFTYYLLAIQSSM